MDEFNTFKKLVKDFEALQQQYIKLGAEDTEPDSIFQECLRNAFRGEFVIPTYWSLYRQKGSVKASKELTKQAKKCVAALQSITLRDYAKVKIWIEDYCWRTD